MEGVLTFFAGFLAIFTSRIAWRYYRLANLERNRDYPRVSFRVPNRRLLATRKLSNGVSGSSGGFRDTKQQTPRRP